MTRTRAPEQLADQIQALRSDLDRVVAELDRRRHELTDWRLQLRRHKRGVALTVLGVVALVGGVVALRTWQRHRRERPLSRVRRLRRALARMIDDPDAVAAREAAGDEHRVARAGGAFAASFGRHLARR